MYRNRYDGPVEISLNWTALDAKRDKFRQSEEAMLVLLKRDYGLTDVEDDGDCEVRPKIKQWIRIRREEGDIDEMHAMEAFRFTLALHKSNKMH